MGRRRKGVWRTAAVAALLCSIATASRADHGTTVEFHGRHYRVPLQPGQLTDPVYVQRFGYAMEVELPVGFWNSLYHDPAVVTGWQLDGRDMPLWLTLPDDIYFWSSRHLAG